MRSCWATPASVPGLLQQITIAQLFKQQTGISLEAGSPRSESSKVDSGQSSLPGLQRANFLLHLHTSQEEPGALFLFFEGHQPHHGGPTLMMASNANDLLKAPLPNAIPLGGGLQHVNWEVQACSPLYFYFHSSSKGSDHSHSLGFKYSPTFPPFV